MGSHLILITVQVPALTFSYCCSPALTFTLLLFTIPFVVLLLALNENNKKMVERSGTLVLYIHRLHVNRLAYCMQQHLQATRVRTVASRALAFRFRLSVALPLDHALDDRLARLLARAVVA